MIRGARRFTTLAGAVILAMVAVACADDQSATIASPEPVNTTAFSYVPPYQTCGLAGGPTCVGEPSDGLVIWERLQVCKYYPSGTVNPPAVTVHLSVVSTSALLLSPTEMDFTIQPNTCKYLWQNGAIFPNPDLVTVTEQVPAGYTATSQVSTVTQNGTPVVYAPTSSNTASGVIGGTNKPGMLVVFTNTLNPPPPGNGCTLTQGYWKNHEEDWAAPYSPTAQWLDATHKVTGLTWDGLMGKSAAGGNSYIKLAHQWIAASLNKASGASVPTAVQNALDLGGAWLLANTPAVTSSVPNIKNDQANGWATTLDNYNNGLTGPGHCGN